MLDVVWKYLKMAEETPSSENISGTILTTTLCSRIAFSVVVPITQIIFLSKNVTISLTHNNFKKFSKDEGLVKIKMSGLHVDIFSNSFDSLSGLFSITS